MDTDNENFDREMSMKEEQWAKEYAMKKEAQDLDNELAKLNIEKTKQALSGMVLGGSRGGGGGGRRGRRKKEKNTTIKNGKPTVNVFDLLDSAQPYFNKGANNVTATPTPAMNAKNALQAAYAMDGTDYDLNTMPDDALTYITRNELRKAREKRGF